MGRAGRCGAVGPPPWFSVLAGSASRVVDANDAEENGAERRRGGGVSSPPPLVGRGGEKIGATAEEEGGVWKG